MRRPFSIVEVQLILCYLASSVNLIGMLVPGDFKVCHSLKPVKESKTEQWF